MSALGAMSAHNATIRDHIEVRTHPTVVRLSDLESANAEWLSESFVLTPEIDNHLRSLRQVLARGAGCGVFVIGHYGSGKSHFLGYLTQQLRLDSFVTEPPYVVPVSLVNFSAANRLEDIVSGAVGIETGPGDRRATWNKLYARSPGGFLLVLDELSEFLRSKADAHLFNEDVRFLQFLGEWCQDKRFWILGAMQEGIEHTGELEYSLYRKIKDRYRLRLLLSPAHVRTLIAQAMLVKKAGYEQAVQQLVADLREVYPEAALDYSALEAIYPLNPATLELLEQVRDRFSQARGVVDFVVARLRGDTARGIEPFLEQPWGSLVTPELIVDHFRDLFEIQPEFQGLAQQVFPWYQKHLREIFERPALQELAERLLKLLVLVHLSPARSALTAAEAAAWILFSATRVDPERNLRIVQRVFSQLSERGRYVAEHKGAYRLDLTDQGGALFEEQLRREMAALRGQYELILEALVPLLPRKVRERMREWQRAGFETGPEMASYLEGKRLVPEVRDVDLLDQHLAGLELVKEVDESVILELLRQRAWDAAELVRAVERQLKGLGGRRLRFRPAAVGSNAVPQEVVRWCGAQALQHGVTLPKGLDRAALRTISDEIRPDRIGPLALQRLEELGLDENGTDRIVRWLVDGSLALPDTPAPTGSLLRAIHELLRPSTVAGPSELAMVSADLYRHHARLQRLAGERWRERLEAVARVELNGVPPLTQVLEEHADAQWLLLDCLGLPLVHQLHGVIEQVFSRWKLPTLRFAEVSADTSTNGCYRELVNAGIQHSFEKLDVVDELIHEGYKPLGDLAALAATQLQLASKKVLSRLDPGDPLLIFADHGFRIAAEGRGYRHGGDSTLERIVPIWILINYGS
jgi:hypothetical protein